MTFNAKINCLCSHRHIFRPFLHCRVMLICASFGGLIIHYHFPFSYPSIIFRIAFFLSHFYFSPFTLCILSICFVHDILSTPTITEPPSGKSEIRSYGTELVHRKKVDDKGGICTANGLCKVKLFSFY